VRIDFRYGRPAIDEFPLDIWRRLLAANAKRPARDSLGYAPPAGHASMREALAEYLNRARGLHCDAEQIVIVNGSQQGIDLATRVLLDPGDAAVIEEPHYTGATVPIEASARADPRRHRRAGARHAQLPASEPRDAWPT
jgi:GntR family transcriptional regulator/MocR family aminotransferase